MSETTTTTPSTQSQVATLAEFPAEVAAFAAQQGREPRCVAELEAWSDTVEVFLAYLAANPVDAVRAAAEAQAAVIGKPEFDLAGMVKTTAALMAAVAERQEASANGAAAGKTCPNPVPPTPAEQEAMEETAEQLRKDCKTAYRAGEREYRKGLLEAGRLAHEYVVVQLKRGQVRKQATSTLEGDLNAYSSTLVDVNRLIRCYSAFSLLAESQGLVKAAGGMAYGSYNESWSCLTECVAQGTPEEHYVLLPGLEEECKATFKAAVEGGWSKESCLEHSRPLVRKGADLQAAAKRDTEAKARAEREAAAKTAAESEEQRRKAAVERQRLVEQVEADKRAEQGAKDEATRQDMERQRVAHEQQLEAKRREEADKQARADTDAREKLDAEKREKQAEKERQAAEREQERLAKQGQGKGGKKGDKQEPAKVTVEPAAKDTRPCHQGESLLVTLARTAKAAPTKDLGSMLASTVRANDDWMGTWHDAAAALATQLDADKTDGDGPDGVLEAVLTALENHKALSGRARKAIQAAMQVLNASTKVPVGQVLPTSAKTPASNGQLIAAS